MIPSQLKSQRLARLARLPRTSVPDLFAKNISTLSMTLSGFVIFVFKHWGILCPPSITFHGAKGGTYIKPPTLTAVKCC